MYISLCVLHTHTHKHKLFLRRKPFAMIHIYCFSSQSSIIIIIAVDRLWWPISAKPFCHLLRCIFVCVCIKVMQAQIPHIFSITIFFSQMTPTKTGKILGNEYISLAKLIFTWILSMLWNYDATMLLLIKLYTWPFLSSCNGEIWEEILRNVVYLFLSQWKQFNYKYQQKC